jgi:hypothetical protein
MDVLPRLTPQIVAGRLGIARLKQPPRLRIRDYRQGGDQSKSGEIRDSHELGPSFLRQSIMNGEGGVWRIPNNSEFRNQNAEVPRKEIGG